MEIKTKFSTNQEIWFINRSGLVRHAKIIEIFIRVLSEALSVTYHTDTGNKVLEEAAFATKEELKDYLLNHV